MKLIFANIVGAGMPMVLSRQVARLAFVDGHLLVPGVLLFVFMGAWLDTPDIASWATVLALGTIGYMMKRGGWPRPALVLGFVVGLVMESALVLSSQTYSFADILSRPLSLILIVLLVLALVLAVRTTVWARTAAGRRDADKADTEGRPHSLVLGAMFCVAFIAAVWPALGWTPSAKLFPLVIAPIGFGVAAISLGRDLQSRRHSAARTPSQDNDRRSIMFLLWLSALIAVTFFFGQPLALVAFVALYLWYWGGYRLPAILAYAGGAGLVLYLVYDQVLFIRWWDPVFSLLQ